MNRVVAALLACSSLSNGAIAARPEVGPDPNNETQVLGKRVSGFRVQGLPLVDALIQLGMATGQPMGIEYVDLESLEKPTSFSLDHGTLGEGLRLILAGRKSYTWRVENAVLVVTNAFVRRGRANLLHRVLPAFSIPRCTLQEASHELEMDLTQQLHPGMGIIGARRLSSARAPTGSSRPGSLGGSGPSPGIGPSAKLRILARCRVQ